MNIGDWVVTPEGIGRVGSFSNSHSKDKMNVFVWIGINIYAFALHLVTPLDKSVSDILNTTKE
jgi:hypothetical protein